MFDLFIAGGPGAMSLLSVELVCLFFAAWKAPAWVREIGLLALVTGCFWQFAGLFQAAGVVAEVGEWPSVGLLLNGLDRKSTRLNSSHTTVSRMPSSA